jgi:hypothetical protein
MRGLSMEICSCLLSDAWNFEAAPRFVENLCTLVIYDKRRVTVEWNECKTYQLCMQSGNM